jgi:2-haloacid dehalogenase
MMAYKLFLFDVDDTLLDFKASERISITHVFEELGIHDPKNDIFTTYKTETDKLWKQLEAGQISKDFLKSERFKRTFATYKIQADPHKASDLYLQALQETVVLIDHAKEILQDLSRVGEVGIVTNGIESVQHHRLKKSRLDQFISFVAVSESAGFAKPDVRFFEHTARLAKKFSKDSALVIGDRLETDILGARNFGVDSCWFNPHRLEIHGDIKPRHKIFHLSEIRGLKK